MCCQDALGALSNSSSSNKPPACNWAAAKLAWLRHDVAGGTEDAGCALRNVPSRQLH